MRERDTLVYYLINSRQNKNSKKLISQFQTLSINTINAILDEYVKMCMMFNYIRCFLSV